MVIIPRLFAMPLRTIAAIKHCTVKEYVEALQLTGASHTWLAFC
jgi:hypothetical protein